MGRTLNPRTSVNLDLDISRVDAGINEKMSANEGLFANLDDVIPRVLRGRR